MKAPITEICKSDWYRRDCEYCGTMWASHHCIHDGAQGRCPECGKRPTVIDGDCDCEYDNIFDYEYTPPSI